MYRAFAAVALAATLLVIGTPPAAQAAPNCYTAYAPTYDMAGQYFAPDLDAYIGINNCGGVQVVWENTWGMHDAQYHAYERVRGGGFFAKGYSAFQGIYPNGAGAIIIKPAERGYIQMLTFDSYANMTGQYRLRKLS